MVGVTQPAGRAHGQHAWLMQFEVFRGVWVGFSVETGVIWERVRLEDECVLDFGE